MNKVKFSLVCGAWMPVETFGMSSDFYYCRLKRACEEIAIKLFLLSKQDSTVKTETFNRRCT
jgi:hypothetical protein